MAAKGKKPPPTAAKSSPKSKKTPRSRKKKQDEPGRGSRGFFAFAVAAVVAAVVFVLLRGRQKAGRPSVVDSRPSLALAAHRAIAAGDPSAAAALFANMVDIDGGDAFALLWRGHMLVEATRGQNQPLSSLGAAREVLEAACAAIPARVVAETESEALTAATAKARCELDVRRLRDRERRLGHALPATVVPIPRISRQKLTTDRFLELAGPIIVEGYLEGDDDDDEPPLFEEKLRRLCGEARPPKRRYAAGDPTWAGLVNLEEEERATVAELLDGLRDGGEAPDFVFDWPLVGEHGCEALLDGLRLPGPIAGSVAYFGPSAFIQPAGARCGTHVDSQSTAFVQQLHQGEKLWRTLEPGTLGDAFASHEAWLAAFFRDSRCSAAFSDAQRAGVHCDGFGAAPPPLFEDELGGPLVGPTIVYEGLAKAGDTIFIPADAPHQVKVTRGPSIAVSLNYVGRANLEAVLADALESSSSADDGQHLRLATGAGEWFERCELAKLHPLADHLVGLHLTGHLEQLLARDPGANATISFREFDIPGTQLSFGD